MLEEMLKAMPFRNVGPSRGGRVVTVAGNANNPAVYYFGAVCGGVFKTTDAGITWLNVSDGFFKTSSVGALAVSLSDPNVIYAGMGEATIRTDVGYGDGVYKSTDAGMTWTHTGLEDTRHIGKIVIHPKNPDIAYVAALGHAFGKNKERGVFRTTDGGANWKKVLYKSDKAGAVDITLDAHNPNVLYASIWQCHRNFWELSSGGPDSGLWRSRDGGDTWEQIDQKKGLDGLGLLGKIGVSASPVQPGRVYALIEAKAKPGMYRSDDFGETWAHTSDLGDLRRRPFYYMHVDCDTQEADTVFVNNLNFLKSTDAGKTWTTIPTPHGDNHGLWIDPKNNRRMIQSNDGGANISFNGGETFGSIYNQLTGQFYHIAADNQFPYRIYATQQDNSSISVPSDSITGAITWGDCYVAGTGESGYIAVKPDDPNIVIVGAVGSSPGGLGSLQKYDHRTGQIQLINIWPQPYNAVDPSTFTHRFPWTFPILFSPHDPNTLYVCGDKVWRSRDLGHSWECLSPDLTRNDPSKLKMSGGPITPDTSGAEFYCDIYAFAESPTKQGVFMAGSDDGLVHLSINDGKTWKNITPPDLPEWTFVRTIEPSPHDANTWYLAATRYKLDDVAPYLYVTRDNGKTWKKITKGIPATEYTRVIRADPERRGLLYAGTELGLFVSLDDGANWQRWTGSLPVTPVYDLLVKDSDLIVGTHGRGFWILDDLSALRQYSDKVPKKGPRVYTPAPAHRILPDMTESWYPSTGKSYGLGGGDSAINIAETTETGHTKRRILDAGHGRDKGVILYYHLPEGLSAADRAQMTLEFVDNSGMVVRAFKPKPADYDQWDDKRKGLEPGPWIGTKPGLNRFVWNLRHAGAVRVAGNKTATETNVGPLVTPGHYQARFSAGKVVETVVVEVLSDRRVSTSAADLREQERLLLAMRDKVSAAHTTVNRLRAMREQAQAWQKRAAGQPKIVAACEAIVKKLDGIEDALILPGEQKDDYGLVMRTRLNAAVAELSSVVSSSDSKPTAVAYVLFDKHAAAIDAEIAKLAAVEKSDITALNGLIAAANIPAIG